MIQLDKDGVTLFYIDANGNRVAHNYMEGQAYTDMLVIRDAQIAAALANTQAVANYNNVLANVQISVTAGRGDTVTVPAKPLQEVVADADGAVTYVPFVPPLADIVPPLPAVPSGGIAAPSLDKETIMYNAIQLMLPKIVALYQKEFPNG
jgi:hypothetical protein